MPRLYFLIGLPAGGKSTYARDRLDADPAIEWISSDNIRIELGITEYDKASNALVFSTMKYRTISALRSGKDVIYDATNLSKKRIATLQDIRSRCPETVIEEVFFCTPIDKCIERDAEREARVGKEVIMRLLKSFYSPAHDIIGGYADTISYVEYGKHFYNTYEAMDYVQELKKFNQHNKWHGSSLGGHIKQCVNMAPTKLKIPFLYHDFGKQLTRSWDGKQAHYYNHQNVSAYMHLVDYHYYMDLYDNLLIERHDTPADSRKNQEIERLLEKGYFGTRRNFIEDLVLFHSIDSYRTLKEKIIMFFKRIWYKI